MSFVVSMMNFIVTNATVSVILVVKVVEIQLKESMQVAIEMDILIASIAGIVDMRM